MIETAGDLQNLLETAFDELMTSVHTCFPAVVKSYDASKREAIVVGQIKKKFANGQIVSMPAISRVPVIFQGTKNARISFPLAAGDSGLVHVTERSIEEWLDNPGEVLPADPRRFSLCDAVFVPGLFSQASPGKEGDGDGMEILYRDSLIQMKDNGDVLVTAQGHVTFAGTRFDLGGSTHALTLHDLLNTALQSYNTQVKSHLAAAGDPASGLLNLDISAAASAVAKAGS